MAYYWKCKKHNEVALERLDETGTKIIPYCSHCECQKKLERVKIEREQTYQKDLLREQKEYQQKLTEYERELTESKFLKNLPLYLIATFFLGLGLINIYFGITDRTIHFIAGSVVAFIGGYLFYIIFTQKPIKPELTNVEKPERLYITTIYNQNEGLFKSQQAEVDRYKERLKLEYENQTIGVKEMNEIDNMDGFEFEYFVAKLLKNMGYSEAEVTQRSGDFGADIIAVDGNGLMIAIQCKRYGTKNLVGNDAVQQIHSAKDYYDCQKAMVITTSNFSKPALQMANKLGVELWNRKALKEKIASTSKESWNDFISKYYIRPNNPIPLANDKVNYIKHESV